MTTFLAPAKLIKFNVPSVFYSKCAYQILTPDLDWDEIKIKYRVIRGYI